jgi:hypothetical protein
MTPYSVLEYLDLKVGDIVIFKVSAKNATTLLTKAEVLHFDSNYVTFQCFPSIGMLPWAVISHLQINDESTIHNPQNLIDSNGSNFI